MLNSPPWDDTVRLDDTSGKGASWRFFGRIATIAAYTPAEVVPSLFKVEEAAANGRFAVGFVAYEAAAALNDALVSLPPLDDLPLVWFAVFTDRQRIEKTAEIPGKTGEILSFCNGLDQSRYLRDVEEVRARIALGECYQANYTFSCSAPHVADPEAVYRHIMRTQKASYCAWLNTGRFAVMSASPELFFSRAGNRIVTRPMKGTAARGMERGGDALSLARLAADPKERAENLMIVDLLRNDLGMISETGSVRVEALFDVETYPTLHQMTSTITAELKPDTGLLQLFRALFPCGSVTGAPKRKTMEILASLEARPRGVYCGAIGMVAPGNEAIFSVPIRTLVCDLETHAVTMGVGSGITWDSDPRAELAECHTKMGFAGSSLPDSGLIESLRCEQGSCARMERHLERMAWSARRIGIPFDLEEAESVLTTHAAALSGVNKVRLLLSAQGALSVTSGPIKADEGPLRIALSATAVDPGDLSLYLKLSERSSYEAVKGAHPDADEVVMTNTRGELTEGTFHNLVLKLNGRLVTPPVPSGLLPGVMRGALLDEGVIAEQVLYPADLEAAEEIWLINSVRGWRPGVFASRFLPGVFSFSLRPRVPYGIRRFPRGVAQPG